jgi:hypothetical protein
MAGPAERMFSDILSAVGTSVRHPRKRPGIGHDELFYF